MEVKVLEETKTKFSFQLVGETHTFCNMLKSGLHDIKGVITATYKIDHPLVGIPTFIVETKGIEARAAVKRALKNLKKSAVEFQKEIKNL